MPSLRVSIDQSNQHEKDEMRIVSEGKRERGGGENETIETIETINVQIERESHSDYLSLESLSCLIE
jgi:hypothetical protein